jgi:hypothetical protein
MADALGCEESNALRRQALFSQVAEWGLEFRVDAPDPADLVREDRDR